MNTIEKELQLNIFGEGADQYNPFTHKKSDEEVVKSCLSIVEKNAIGFSLWCYRNKFEIDLVINDGETVYYFNSEQRYNQTLLFQQYIQSLK